MKATDVTTFSFHVSVAGVLEPIGLVLSGFPLYLRNRFGDFDAVWGSLLIVCVDPWRKTLNKTVNHKVNHEAAAIFCTTQKQPHSGSRDFGVFSTI